MKKRKTIGVLVDSTDTDFQRGILAGIRTAAELNDINLLVIEGGVCRFPFRHDNYRTYIYQLAQSRRFDGLIIFTASIGLFLDDTEIADFNRQFSSVPLVNIATTCEDIHSILVDNRPGMRDMMKHLVVEHGYRRFLYIKGPEGNYDAETRYSHYLQTLTEYGLNPADSHMIYGNFMYASAIDALTAHITQHGITFDAVVTASDEMATAAYKVLQKNGVEIPSDVAVCGFDNFRSSIYLDPPLTTVSQPFLRLGMQAITVLLQKIAGDNPPLHTYLPSTFIRRQSCGCTREKNRKLEDYADNPGVTDTGDFVRQITPAIDTDLSQILFTILTKHTRNDIQTTRDNLLQNFARSIFAQETEPFITCWRQLVVQSVPFYRDFYTLNEILLLIASHALKLFRNNAHILFIYELWRTGIEEIAKDSIHLERQRNLDYEIESRVLDDIRTSLMHMNSVDDLQTILTTSMPHLAAVNDCFICLFSAPDDRLPDKSHLAFACTKDTTHSIPESEANFPTLDILPDSLFSGLDSFQYHIELMMTPQQRLGFMIIDLNLEDRHILRSFREVLSHSLFSRQLISKINTQKEDLKNNLSVIQKAMGGFIQTLQHTVEIRDPYTAGHQRRVSELARTIARTMKLPDKMVESIRIAAIIHDIGKIYVPAEILNKPGKLKEIEISLIRSHPEIAHDILQPIDFPWPIAEIVLQHHEHLDGTGYPRGLRDNEIMTEARIITVADVVEAMASHRPYRASLGLDVALEEIKSHSGIWYDPHVVDTCIHIIKSKEFRFSVDSDEDPSVVPASFTTGRS